MTRCLYLICILASLAGVLALDRRLATGIASRHLLRALMVTLPTFLAFDTIGAARGWFSSDPHLNLFIIPPGLPLEEPILLAFLTVTSVALGQGIRRVLR